MTEHTQPAQKIIMVTSGQGGTGKSFVSMSLLDFFGKKNTAALLVEADISVPDVAKTYMQTVLTAPISLDSSAGWVELVNTIARHPERAVVINMPPRSSEAVAEHGSILTGALSELGRKLETLWVINRARASLSSLHDHTNHLECQTHVVINGHFGDCEQFELYEASDVRKLVEASGGQSVYFPSLADRVTDKLFNERSTIAEAMDSMPLGERSVLAAWRSRVANALNSLELTS